MAGTRAWITPRLLRVGQLGSKQARAVIVQEWIEVLAAVGIEAIRMTPAEAGPQIRSDPLCCCRAVDMWTMRAKARTGTTRGQRGDTRCPPPAPSPTCPQPSTTVEKAKTSGPNILASPTTDRPTARRRSQGAPGSYLNWKRLRGVPEQRPQGQAAGQQPGSVAGV